MATLRTFKGNIPAKDAKIKLMCLCATSPSVAFVRQWLNQGVKHVAACGHTALPCQWHGITSTHTACLKPNSNDREFGAGGGGTKWYTTVHKNNNNTSLIIQ
jgi:hypothetical protein